MPDAGRNLTGAFSRSDQHPQANGTFQLGQFGMEASILVLGDCQFATRGGDGARDVFGTVVRHDAVRPWRTASSRCRTCAPVTAGVQLRATSDFAWAPLALPSSGCSTTWRISAPMWSRSGSAQTAPRM